MNYHHPFSSPTAWRGLENHLDYFLSDVDPINLVVELGVDKGYSLGQFAIRYPRSDIIGVDNFCYGDGKAALDMLNDVLPKQFPNVELVVMDTADAADSLADRCAIQPVDVLHIDAGHAYHEVKRDFEAWESLVRPGGVVLFHDVLSFPDDVGRFFSELRGRKKSVPFHCGLGGWYKE